jgi:spore germination cell wall hydrolase CwlJ-like protein
MSPHRFLDDLAWRLGGAWLDARRGLRLAWYRADREAMAFALMIGAALVAFGFGLHSVFERHERARALALEAERQNLLCLAKNVYYEARGEPAEGQYAVAEVTMNRLASSRYPDSVCAVVHEKRWDAIRGRYVGAFSWTEFYAVPEPEGQAWEHARKVAEDVYYKRTPPTLDGATFYHATDIRPSWARTQERVARIGRHVFYR